MQVSCPHSGSQTGPGPPMASEPEQGRHLAASACVTRGLRSARGCGVAFESSNIFHHICSAQLGEVPNTW